MQASSFPHRAPFVVALALLFSGLLLSTAVMPTLVASTCGKACVAAPVTTEEEQLHGRDVHKLGTVPDRSWCCSALVLGLRMRAAFRDRDVALPNGPISDVPLQPPRIA